MDIKLPELGENIHSAEVVQITVAVGDSIAAGQTILELETDKAVVEVPAPSAGTVDEILVRAGQTVRVGEVVMRLKGDGAAANDPQAKVASAAPDAKTPAAAADKPPVKDRRPDADAPATPEPGPAPAPKPAAEPSSEPAAPSASKAEPKPDDTPPAKAATVDGTPPLAAPHVIRLARELGVDLAAVPADADGRVGEAALLAFVRGRIGGQRGSAGEGPVRHAMDNVRKATARQMAKSWAEIPHVTHDDKADIQELERQRKHLAARIEAEGGRLTMTVLLVKALAAALGEFPKFRSSLDMAKEVILEHPDIHIGIAVDTDRGLLVPVVRDADRKSLGELAREIDELAAAARERKLGPEAMRGARMTLTNLGGIGGTRFSPLVNPPEVAVLGVARARPEPVWQDGAFVPRLMLPLSLSYDHRLIDGADAARFARWLVEALENPLQIFAD
jgi:pyruvate dehydrogenase E2 component (dihydrolipoamide acetyltransferase)